ncbi:MAG: HupE/UreJ family protein [Chitinophagaceae bacterium]|nr:HupE/UreJ family protein [Chitinophagaceae bacterium]
MNDFLFYFREGIYHITDLRGYDHILFVVALCLPYLIGDWRKIVILVTAFTIGHSATLALSIYNKILVPSVWIEFLIPVTIVITALENLTVRKFDFRKSSIRYVSALVFGLIHGMGFSNYLRSMMGKQESIWGQLLAFNIGLEIGQLFIVAIVLLLAFVFVTLLKIPRREWLLFISGGIFAIALLMAVNRYAEIGA